MERLPVLLGDAKAWQGPAYYGGCTQYIAALQEIEAPVCSKVRRKRTVAIKRLIKRDSARRMYLSLHLSGQARQ